MYEMRSPQVLPRRRGDFPIAPDVISRMPPAVLLGVMDEPQPPLDHGGRHPYHVGAHTYVNDARVEPFPARFKREIEAVEQLVGI